MTLALSSYWFSHRRASRRVLLENAEKLAVVHGVLGLHVAAMSDAAPSEQPLIAQVRTAGRGFSSALPPPRPTDHCLSALCSVRHPTNP